MGLIGNGKWLYLCSNQRAKLWSCLRNFGLRFNDQKDQQFGVVVRTYVRNHQYRRLQHPQEKSQEKDWNARRWRPHQNSTSESMHNWIHHSRAFNIRLPIYKWEVSAKFSIHEQVSQTYSNFALLDVMKS